MNDLNVLQVSCSKPEEIVQAVNEVTRNLPSDIGRRLARILAYYFSKYRLVGAYERMNKKTVSQIFNEFHAASLDVVSSGEVDGIRFRLYEAPSPREGNGTAEESGG